MKHKILVLDTNVLLTDSNSILNFEDADIAIPLKVLDEIDNHKKRQDSVGMHARSIIRKLDELRSAGNLFEGVDIGTGKVYVKGYDAFKLPDDLDIENPDNQIIATALSLRAENKKSSVILISRDINMRVKCDALGIECDDYSNDQVVDDIEGLYTGLAERLVDDQIVDSVYKDSSSVYLDADELSLQPNQFVMLISNSNEKKSALVRFSSYDKTVQKVDSFKKGVWGVRPKNKEQNFALDLLTDPSVPLVTIIGKAGSGKTLLALACGLQQCFGETANDRKYSRVIVTKPVEPVGKDIGFLPGSMEEKMMPWLAPIQDNLRNLMGNDKITLDMYIDEGKIEIEAMTFIRGRSISNAFIIIDEAQNMTKHEIKTVLTRVGEGTKIVLTGDIEQIDNAYLDETTNGLTYVIDRFKEQSSAGHITLVKGERSQIATLAARLL